MAIKYESIKAQAVILLQNDGWNSSDIEKALSVSNAFVEEVLYYL